MQSSKAMAALRMQLSSAREEERAAQMGQAEVKAATRVHTERLNEARAALLQREAAMDAIEVGWGSGEGSVGAVDVGALDGGVGGRGRGGRLPSKRSRSGEVLRCGPSGAHGLSSDDASGGGLCGGSSDETAVLRLEVELRSLISDPSAAAKAAARQSERRRRAALEVTRLEAMSERAAEAAAVHPSGTCHHSLWKSSAADMLGVRVCGLTRRAARRWPRRNDAGMLRRSGESLTRWPRRRRRGAQI